MPSGRNARKRANASEDNADPAGPAPSPAARSTISRARPGSQLRSSNRSLATGGVGAALISAIISSTLASATARPSSK